jgi:energy-coupling factor transport system ATP-binding protein
MDRARKAELAEFGRHLSDRGTAVMIATHDVEFAATFADRVVLLARGEVAADDSATELLSGGWYFSS